MLIISRFLFFLYGHNKVKGSDNIKNINRRRLFLNITRILYVFTLVLVAFLLSKEEVKTSLVSKNDTYVCLGGESIGLNLNTGINVIGKYEVSTDDGTYKPWSDCDISKNDIITKIDGIDVDTIDDMVKIIDEEKEYKIEYLSNGYLKTDTIKGVRNKNGTVSIGLYVKDNVLGVGTLTFYDLKTKRFAGLGHNATDSLVKGTIHNSYVRGVTKGIRGLPGEKKATLDQVAIGDISLNNKFGIFGTLYDTFDEAELVSLGDIKDAHPGHATITTVIEGDKKEEFDIEILEAENQTNESIKGIKYQVTDKDLLEKTGGIIQGMSGSPIMQDGKLIGAVSHVVVDDSKVGYGVYAKFMFNYLNN